MSLRESLSQELSQRALSGGGFADRSGGQFRVDATAWGILVSEAFGYGHDRLDLHRSRLILEQADDGRVRVSLGHPESYWPTALAILAWQGASISHIAEARAVRFLLTASGVHFTKKFDSPSAHDTGLKGWPWIENTHSWVEPTAMCVIALRAAGYGQHDRVQEAVRMILDRQLPRGGWNAGNTIVFGKELHPMAEGTGVALTCLSGMIEERMVVKSLEYLEGEVDRVRTPISLGWTLMGLGAWGRRPSNAIGLVERCIARQSRYGEYDTASLCLVSLAGSSGQTNSYFPLGQIQKFNQTQTIHRDFIGE